MKFHTNIVYDYDVRAQIIATGEWITIRKSQGTLTEMENEVKRLQSQFRSKCHYKDMYAKPGNPYDVPGIAHRLAVA